MELREEMGEQRSLTERLVTSRLQWAGHIERMADDRLPKRAAEYRKRCTAFSPLAKSPPAISPADNDPPAKSPLVDYNYIRSYLLMILFAAVKSKRVSLK